MPTARKRPADFTGQQTVKLQDAKRAEVIEASQRMALITAELNAEVDIPVDYTGSAEPMPEVQVREAVVNSPFRMVRLTTDLPQMTYGRIVADPGDYTNPDLTKRRPAVMGGLNEYNFKEGQLYRVPVEVAEHLRVKGYIAYMGGV